MATEQLARSPDRAIARGEPAAGAAGRATIPGRAAASAQSSSTRS